MAYANVKTNRGNAPKGERWMKRAEVKIAARKARRAEDKKEAN